MKTGNTFVPLSPWDAIIQNFRFHWQSSGTSISLAANHEICFVCCSQWEMHGVDQLMPATSLSFFIVGTLFASEEWIAFTQTASEVFLTTTEKSHHKEMAF